MRFAILLALLLIGSPMYASTRLVCGGSATPLKDGIPMSPLKRHDATVWISDDSKVMIWEMSASRTVFQVTVDNIYMIAGVDTGFLPGSITVSKKNLNATIITSFVFDGESTVTNFFYQCSQEF